MKVSAYPVTRPHLRMSGGVWLVVRPDIRPDIYLVPPWMHNPVLRTIQINAAVRWAIERNRSIGLTQHVTASAPMKLEVGRAVQQRQPLQMYNRCPVPHDEEG